MIIYTPIDIPRNKCFGSNYFETYSLKLKRNVRLFSDLEYKNFLTLEMNSDVLEFCEQPLKIDIEVDGKIESSIFDMWVHYRNNSYEMQEVKYSRDIDPGNEFNKRARRQIQKQEQWCKMNGYAYSIRTETVIETGTYYINNLRYLFGLIKRIKCHQYRGYIKKLKEIVLLDKVMIKDIIKRNILPDEVILPSIALGIYEGYLRANLSDKIFSFETEVWLNTK